jgi:hypothetical protein
VVEIEGRAFHGTPEQHQADIARFNALMRVPGIVALRFSWADVLHRPAAMVASVRAAAARLTRASAAAADIGADTAPTGGYVRARAVDR